MEIESRIYARWRGQSDAEFDAQINSWNPIDGGRLGFLNDVHTNDEDGALSFLCAEAFDSGHASILADVLVERLPETIRRLEDKDWAVYQYVVLEDILQGFRDFVSLCGEKERATGEPVIFISSRF